MVGEWFLENGIDGWITDFLLIFPTDWYLLLGQKIMAQIHLEHRNDYDDEKDNERSKRCAKEQQQLQTVRQRASCFWIHPIATTLSTSRVCKGRAPHGFQYHQLCQVLATRNEDCCLCNISTLLIVLLPTPRLLVLRKPTPKRKENARLRFYKNAGQQKLEQCK